MREPREGLIRGERAPAWIVRPADRLAWYATVIGLERWARLLAVTLTPALLADRGLVGHTTTLLALATYVALTALARRDRYLRGADLLVAAALIVVSGAEVVAYLPFLLVAVAGVAAQGGLVIGLVAGGSLSAIALIRLAATGELAAAGLLGVLPLTLLLLLAGATTAAASEVVSDRAVRDRFVLQQANRLLTSLRALADEIPGGLDVSTVAAATLAELRTVRGATGALVLSEEHGRLRPVATTGTEQAVPPPVRVGSFLPLLGAGTRLRTPRTLPPELLSSTATHRHWCVLRLGSGTAVSGVLLVGFDDLEAARSARPRLAGIAQDAGLALENAQLFDGTQARAAHSARRLVAGDLHDGVAQSLAHLRMELELLARAGADPDELERLARVAGAALVDLRQTIEDLRRPVETDLPALLDRHLDDVRTPHGPTIDFDRDPGVRLDAARSEELLRIAQEAVSNAVRHAGATRVTVALRDADGRVRLVIEDDGVGLDRERTDHVDGVGLRSIEERAARLGALLTIGPPPGGGTRVALTLPAAVPGRAQGV